MPSPVHTPTTADLLLDAHVAWVVDRLTTGAEAPTLDDAIAEDVDLVLDLISNLTLNQVVEADELIGVIGQVLATVPPSERAAAIALTASDALFEGPIEPFTLADVVDRENVEVLLHLLLSRVDVLEAALDRLTRSPQLARLVGGLVGRIVNDVIAANRAVAERIPGVGSIVSLGARAGGRVKGVADKQFDALLGDTAGKGAQLAMRRLNKVIVDTLRDPGMADALLEVHDLFADQTLPPISAVTTEDGAREFIAVLHEIAAAATPTAPVHDIVATIVRGVFAEHGDVPITELLHDLGLTRDELVVHAITLAPRALAAAHAGGHLEPAVRSRLAPFYASAPVAAILSGDPS